MGFSGQQPPSLSPGTSLVDSKEEVRTCWVFELETHYSIQKSPINTCYCIFPSHAGKTDVMLPVSCWGVEKQMGVGKVKGHPEVSGFTCHSSRNPLWANRPVPQLALVFYALSPPPPPVSASWVLCCPVVLLFILYTHLLKIYYIISFLSTSPLKKIMNIIMLVKLWAHLSKSVIPTPIQC